MNGVGIKMKINHSRERLIHKIKNLKFFRSRQVDLRGKVRESYLHSGIAVIPCRVNGFYDIISRYSVHGHEVLNPDFEQYVQDAISFIPPEYPVVLKIIGYDFSENQQNIIRDTIGEDFSYELGVIQNENRRQAIKVALVGIGMILFGFLVSYINGLDGLPFEFLYIIFWFFANVFITYVFFDGREGQRLRVMAGRLACVGVSFEKRYKDDITNKEVRKVFREIFDE